MDSLGGTDERISKDGKAFGCEMRSGILRLYTRGGGGITGRREEKPVGSRWTWHNEKSLEGAEIIGENTDQTLRRDEMGHTNRDDRRQVDSLTGGQFQLWVTATSDGQNTHFHKFVDFNRLDYLVLEESPWKMDQKLTFSLQKDPKTWRARTRNNSAACGFGVLEHSAQLPRLYGYRRSKTTTNKKRENIEKHGN